jgi:hypothetical protein
MCHCIDNLDRRYVMVGPKYDVPRAHSGLCLANA